MSGYSTIEIIGILLGTASTLAIYSFLIRENAYYRLFEHMFIGLGMGYGLVVTYYQYLKPKVIMSFTGNQGHADMNWMILIYILPGFLYYFIFSKKLNWLARLWIGFLMGITGGAIFRILMNTFLQQVTGSFKSVWMPEFFTFASNSTISNIIFLVTLCCVMSYFFFSVEQDKPVIKQASSGGRLLMMVGFGAIFGTTVMARMSLFIERAQFLFNEFGGLVSKLVGLS